MVQHLLNGFKAEKIRAFYDYIIEIEPQVTTRCTFALYIQFQRVLPSLYYVTN
jgi:hypothetical protein